MHKIIVFLQINALATQALAPLYIYVHVCMSVCQCMHACLCVSVCACMFVCVGGGEGGCVHAWITCDRTRRWASKTRSRVVGGEQV